MPNRLSPLIFQTCPTRSSDRCTRCSHICAGRNGVRHHQSKNPTCAALTDVPPPLLQSRSSYLDRRIPSTEPSPFDDDALLSLFSAGLFNVHRTCSDKLHPVSSRLLTIIVENRASIAPIASLFSLVSSGRTTNTGRSLYHYS